MKCVILAGGFGTRISEETNIKPKPMVEIGGLPILWHIMKMYSSYGINEFIICCGYKGYVIKEYFSNYFLHMSDVTFDMSTNEMKVHQASAEPWKVTLVDTGDNVQTGGRIKRISNYVKDDESFCLTYGDGLSDVNLKELIEFHNKHERLVTVTAVSPPGRYGSLECRGSQVFNFSEKPKGDGAIINGGFFVLSPKCLEMIGGDGTIWESETLHAIAKQGELSAFKHSGFWQSMDTLREKNILEKLWKEGDAPWKKWK
jgi:glucose-1-phosphate cytidylyltransferase